MHYRIRYIQVKYQLNRKRGLSKPSTQKKNCMDGRIDGRIDGRTDVAYDNNRYFFEETKKNTNNTSHNCRTGCTH